MTTQEILQAAQTARMPLALADADTKNAALEAMAVALIAASDKILEANQRDLDAARGRVSDVMLDRLALNESRIAGMLYAIPGVKGVEFGRGFALAEMRGSEANDPIRLKNGRITMASNNAGGINGGITNGMPLVVRMALRPTPSIACEQPSVDLATMEETPLRINGRHDPCLAPRAIPVMEAALACCVLDAMLDTAATI